MSEYILHSLLCFKKRSWFSSVYLILCILFSGSTAHAEHREHTSDTISATITLSKNAQIYSTDQDFNNQILQNRIILKDTRFIHASLNKTGHLVIQHSPENQLKQAHTEDAVSLSVKRRQKKEIERISSEIKKNIADNNSELIHFKDHIPSQKFSSVYLIIKNSILHNSDYYGKFIISGDSRFLINKYFYVTVQQFNNYNSRSLGYCFYELLSVRPPPFM